MMGNQFSISVVGPNEQWAAARLQKAFTEIARIEKLLTTFSDDSQTALINKAAGFHPVTVDAELFELIQRAIRISNLTQGAFDITYGGIDKDLWNFNLQMKSLPTPEKARQMVRLINYKNIVLDHAAQTVFLKEQGMRMGFGGIGKGYAAERAKRVLKDLGVQSGVVNAAGDLTTWGIQPNGQPWTIGIADPNGKRSLFSHFNITDMAVATSGNYEKFVTIGGKKYSHTINPKTGLPVTGIKSVTIICPNAEIADALATPVMVMGIEAGLHLVNQLAQVHCIIIDDNEVLYTSKNITIH